MKAPPELTHEEASKVVDPMLTTRQVCDWLQIGRQTLIRMESRGDVRSIKISPNNKRWAASEIKRYLNKQIS